MNLPGPHSFIKDVEFTDNTSEGNGGAIYTVAEAVDELPEEATYSGNTATNVSNRCSDMVYDTTNSLANPRLLQQPNCYDVGQ